MKNMKKMYTFMIAINLMMISGLFLQAEQGQCPATKDCQQNFIAENGKTGIYQPNQHKAFINGDSYIRVKSLLANGPNKLHKPWNSVYLGELIDGENVYKLYGKDEHPVPVNNGPDGDVRTEIKLREDFMEDFGSGKYTNDDKWD